MADIYYRGEYDLETINEQTRFGIYVIRSKGSFLRVGSVGINSENTRLKKRLNLHGSGVGKGNWTVENRPWSLVWAAEIVCEPKEPDNRRHGVLALEYALFSAFAAHFKAVATSGFDSEGRGSEVAAIIEGFKITLKAIAENQFGPTKCHPEGTPS